MSIQRTLNFLPFFVFGYYINKGTFTFSLWNNKLVSYISIFLIFALIVGDLYPNDCKMILSGTARYGVSGIPAKIYMLVCSFMASLSFYTIMSESKVLSQIGRDSLLYYLYHGLIIKFLLSPLQLYFGLPQTFPFMLLYTIIIISFIYFIGRFKVVRLIVSPIK